MNSVIINNMNNRSIKMTFNSKRATNFGIWSEMLFEALNSGALVLKCKDHPDARISPINEGDNYKAVCSVCGTDIFIQPKKDK